MNIRQMKTIFFLFIVLIYQYRLIKTPFIEFCHIINYLYYFIIYQVFITRLRNFNVSVQSCNWVEVPK